MEDLFVTHNFAGSNLVFTSTEKRNCMAWACNSANLLASAVSPQNIKATKMLFRRKMPSPFISVWCKAQIFWLNATARKKRAHQAEGEGKKIKHFVIINIFFYRQKILKSHHHLSLVWLQFNFLILILCQLVLFTCFFSLIVLKVRTSSFQRPENQEFFLVLFLAVTANSICHSTPMISVQYLQKWTVVPVFSLNWHCSMSFLSARLLNPVFLCPLFYPSSSPWFPGVEMK